VHVAVTQVAGSALRISRIAVIPAPVWPVWGERAYGLFTGRDNADEFHAGLQAN
jgi:hypothetical protein